MAAFSTTGTVGLAYRSGGNIVSGARKARVNLQADPGVAGAIRGIADQLMVSELHVGNGNATSIMDTAGVAKFTFNSDGSASLGLATKTITLAGLLAVTGASQFTGAVIFDGDVTFNGTNHVVEGTTVTYEDSLLLLAKDVADAPSLDVGFIAERGTSQNVAFVWDESADQFVAVLTDDTGVATTVTIADYANMRVGALVSDDGITVSAGGANLTNSGITNAGAISGGTTGVFSGQVTVGSLVINASTAITSVDEDISAVSANHDTLPTAKAVKTYVDSQVGGVNVTGTTSASFTVNTDGAAATDEDPALVLIGGDAVAGPNDDIVKTLFTQDSPGEFVSLRMQRNRNAGGYAEIAPRLELGVNGGVADLDPVLAFNAGTGAAAKVGTIAMDGSADKLIITGTSIELAGNANVTGTMAVTGTSSLAALNMSGDLAIATNKFTVAAASGNTLIAGTLGVTGNTSLTGTLGVNGDVRFGDSGSSYFTVAAATGNTVVAGTLGVSGAVALGANASFAINTNKFTVDSTNGNTVVGGTLQVTGAITASSTLAVTGNLTYLAAQVAQVAGGANGAANTPDTAGEAVYLASDGLRKADAAAIGSAFVLGGYASAAGKVAERGVVSMPKMATNAGGTTFDAMVRGDRVFLAAAIEAEYDAGVTPVAGTISTRTPNTAGSVIYQVGIVDADSDGDTATANVKILPQFIFLN